MMGRILHMMMERSWMTKTMFFTLLLSSLFIIAKADPVEYDPKKIVETFNEAFLASNDDFISPHPQDKYFPFKQARKENVYTERDNFEDINSLEKAVTLTRELQEWRGFKTIETFNLTQLEPFLEEFKTFSQSTQSNFINSKLNKAQLEELSSSWLSLLAQSKIMEDTSVDNMVDIYNQAQLNTNLLYKFFILLRDPNPGTKRDGFMRMDIPGYLEDHVGYMFGYRWNLETPVQLQARTLMVLPSDIIVRMKSDVLSKLQILDTLSRDSALTVFEEGDQQRKNAWFIRYLKEVGWDEAFTSKNPRGGMEFGHLLAGATLEYLQRLELNQTHADDPQNLNLDQDFLFYAVQRNSFSRAREQVLWEAINLDHRKEIFDKKAIKLDISQLLAHEKALGDTSRSGLSQVIPEIQEKWFMEKTFYPEVNAEFFKTRHMDKERFKAPSNTWTTEDLRALARYSKMLSPKEISKLGGEDTTFDKTTIMRLTPPTLSKAQLNEIYKKVKAQIESDTERDLEVIVPSLFPALSSDDLLSSKPHFIWTEHKDQLLEASDMFTRAQMSALHELIKPGKWNSANMSSILANHPKCLDDDPPAKVMESLDLILEGFEAVPEKFYTIAKKLQMIPRHLKMAWLEKAMTDKEVLTTEVLLDKLSKDAALKEGIINPEPSHPLTSTFRKFFSSNSETNLPSLVLAGMSCRHIEMIEVQDTMEVLAMYRYQVEMYGDLMPSSTRKCWAKQVRDYLMFKASVLNITVTTETELLSMLNTPEIKTIGGEILLTLGGSVLSSIVNPEVNHEVLMEVSLTKPVTFLTNGVKYSCVKEMAAAMLGLMLEHEKGSMDLTVFAHTHNLLPFAGNSTVKAEAEDIKNFFRTVLRPEDKLMCLKKDDRTVVRNLIMKAFGYPENWNSLDLVELGDLLLVLEAADWSKVDPTTLRMAAEELAVNTLYSDLITEPRHSTVPVPYHEACALWLGDDQGAESQESKDYADQWRMYSRNIIVGNHLQFKVFDNGLDVETIQPREARRRRREADGTYDFKSNYTYVMNKLNTMFREGSMSEEQKINATNIIIGTQELLADNSFAVLGLERGNLTQQEVLGVLQQYRDSGNMTSEQSALIAKLAIDTQTRMVQGLAPLLGITPEELNITTETWDAILRMKTFGEPEDDSTATTTAQSSEAPARDLLDDEAETPQVTTIKPASDGESDSSSTTSTTNTVSTTEASTSSSTTPEASADSSTEATTSIQSTVSTTESTTAASAASTESTTTVSTESTSTASTLLPDNYREGRDEEASSSTTESTSTTSTMSTSTEASTSSSSTTASSDSDGEAVQESTEATTQASSTTEKTVASSSTEASSSSSSEASTESPASSTVATSTTPASVDDNLSSVLKQNELLNLETFSSYEPDTKAFETIPHLKNITLTCRVVRASKKAAAALSSNCISKMSQEDLVNCWDILGHIPWPSSSLVPVWNVVKESITKEYQGVETPINRDLMLQLETLMPAIVSESPELIDVAKENIDGISSLERLLSWEDAENVVQRYIEVNSKTKDNPLTRVEAGALGPLLCGLNDYLWTTLITNQTFPSLITRYLATLDCPVPTGAAGHLSELLVSAYGSPQSWSTADVLSMGWMVATLSPEHLASVPSHAMEGLTGHAVKHFTARQWTSLTAAQLQYMSPHTASFISVKDLASMEDMGSKMREIRAAVGEDPMVAGEMEKMFDSGSPSLQCSILLLVLAVWACAL